MGFWGDLTGSSAAKVSTAAAKDTYDKQRSAIDRLLGYGNEYQSEMTDLYKPFLQTGYGANDALNRLIADPSSVRSLPGYSFDMSQGTEALDRSAGSHGLLHSGRAAKDLLRFGTGLADKTYGDQLSRLMGVTQGVGGMGASGTAAGYGGNLGARTTAFGGDMTSAGTIGQGMIAGANAKAQGAQNLFNTGANLLGKLLSGGMLMGGGSGGGGGSSFGGGGGGQQIMAMSPNGGTMAPMFL